jgi:hypothetical protein
VADGTLLGLELGDVVGPGVVGVKDTDGIMEGGLVEGIEDGTTVGIFDGSLLDSAEGVSEASGDGALDG